MSTPTNTWKPWKPVSTKNADVKGLVSSFMPSFTKAVNS